MTNNANHKGYKQELSRSLSMRDNLMITLSSITPASSVFIIVPPLLLSLGGASVLLMCLAAIGCIFVGFCYAELTTIYPITGGEYTWVARLINRPTGFAVFALSLLYFLLSVTVIALGTGEYLSVIFPHLNQQWVAANVIILATVIGLLNIRANAVVTGIFLAIEIIATLIVCVYGFMHPVRGISTFFQLRTMPHMAQGLQNMSGQAGSSSHLVSVSIMSMLVLFPTAFFAFTGYGTAVYYVEETRDATKNIAKVIMLCLFCTVLIETLPLAAVIIGSPSLEELLQSPQPFTYFLIIRAGSLINTIVSLGVAIAIINAVVASNLVNSRLLFSSARDKSWPEPIDRFLSTINHRTNAPIGATLCVGIFAAAACLFIPLNWLIQATGACIIAIYLFVAIAALLARNSAIAQAAPRGYRMKLWPLPPIIVIIFMIGALYLSAQENYLPVLITSLILISGAIYYLIYLQPRRESRWTLPEPLSDN